MATRKKTAATDPPAAPTPSAAPEVNPVPTPAAPSEEEKRLRAAALVDPLLAFARREQLAGKAVPPNYYDAWGAVPDPDAYQPPDDLRIWMHEHWRDLLLEGEEGRAKAGRPTLLTPELLDRIDDVARSGAKDPIIYAKLGIRQQLWSEWLKDPEGVLSRTLSKARATMAEITLRGIADMPKGWQAGVWLLTQHYPELFSRPNADTQIHVNASANASASLSVEVTPEVLAKLQERRRQQLAFPLPHERN